MIGWINEIRYFRAHYVAMLVSPPLKTKGTARTRTRKHSRTPGSVLYERYLGKSRFFYTYFFAQKCACTTKRKFWHKIAQPLKNVSPSCFAFFTSFPCTYCFSRLHTCTLPLIYFFRYELTLYLPEYYFPLFLSFSKKSRAMSDVSRSIVVSEWNGCFLCDCSK